MFVKPSRVQTFDVRCAELCGIWHGYMFDHGQVVTPAAFTAWIHQQQATFAPEQRRCRRTAPPISPTPRGAPDDHDRPTSSARARSGGG